MAAVIIRKKDVEKLGKELVKEMFDFLHDEFMLTKFEEMEVLQKVFLERLVSNYSSNSQQKNFDEKLEFIKGKIDNGTLDIDVIYDTLKKMNFDMEMNEDLFYEIKAFLFIYYVFECGYKYLEE